MREQDRDRNRDLEATQCLRLAGKFRDAAERTVGMQRDYYKLMARWFEHRAWEAENE